MTERPLLSTNVLWHCPLDCAPAEDHDDGAASSGRKRSGEAQVRVCDLGLPYRVLLRVSVEPTYVTLESLEVQTLSDDPAVAAEVLRTLPVRAYLTLISFRLGCGDDAVVAPEPSAQPRGQEDEAATLRMVARGYREARASTKPRQRLAPTAAVVRHFAIDREYAGRLVARARRGGVLHPAVPRRPGEARPEDPGEALGRRR